MKYSVDIHFLNVFLFYPQGRFTIAAKHHITIAEVYESELVDIEKVQKCHLV